MRAIRTALLGGALATTLIAAPGHTALRADSLDAMISRLQSMWDVPGFAVAIVEDGRVVLMKGYGVRALGKPERVDERTLFYTGSVTKTFTVLALGMLADQGKLRIDEPVVRYLPQFRLGDSVLTRQVTVRDLLSHRTGLPRADLLMVGGYDPDEIVRRLGALDPVAPIRSRLTYQNQMYLVASRIVAGLTGQTYQEFVEQSILSPLGMRSSNARGIGWTDARAAQAAPHARLDGTIRSITIAPRPPYGGGAINTCAADLSRYLSLLLDEGRLDTTRLVSEAVVRATQQPQIAMSPLAFMPEANLAGYGLGWFLSDYHGEKVVQHGGNAEGWTAFVGLLPHKRLGVAVLTNMNSTALPYAIFMSTVDSSLQHAGKDWGTLFRGLERQMSPPEPPRVIAGITDRDRYVGVYEHPCFGHAEVVADRDSALVLRYGPSVSAHLGPLGTGGFFVRWDEPAWRAVAGGTRASFEPRNERATSLILNVGDGPIAFTRVTGSPGK